MKHHTCRSRRTKVVDKRDAKGDIRRRRECLKCGFRFSTREIHQEEYERLMAIKEALAPKPKTQRSELFQPIWAVVSFEKVEASGLQFDDAVRELDRLQRQDIPGLVIVTIDIAKKMIAIRKSRETREAANAS